MTRTIGRYGCLALAVMLWSGGASAAEEPDPYRVFSLVIENDVLARHNSDDHYSNGLRISVMSGEGALYDRVLDYGTGLPLLDYSGRRRIGWTIGHNLYTPEDKTRRDLIRDDRPYGAILYAGLVLQTESARRQDTIEFDLGVVGPAAWGERIQNDWHRIVGVDAAEGWDNQLKNEPVFNIAFERKWQFLAEAKRWGSIGIDVIPHVSGSIGNAFTYAGVGATFRLGQNLEVDFGPPRIRPALPGSASFEPQGGFAWYLFLGGEVRAVARDIFLDGNTFASSHSVDRNWVTGDVQAGLALVFERVRVSYTQVMRAPEFDGQSKPDFFGSLSLSMRF